MPLIDKNAPIFAPRNANHTMNKGYNNLLLISRPASDQQAI